MENMEAIEKVRPKTICRHFVRGQCKYGSMCHYSHDSNSATAKSRSCRFFDEAGQCKYGDRCRFEHNQS